jgi:hypothetical protein
MELKDILAISGQPGLFKFIAQSTNGVIVESLTDGHRTNATGSAKVSALAEISVYTEDEDRKLSDIFTAMYEKTGGKEAISHKAPQADVVAFFAEAVPDYDRDMVHFSDIKKIISWYNILLGAGMTDFSVDRGGDDEAPAEATE